MSGRGFDFDEGRLRWDGGVADLVGEERRSVERDRVVGLGMRDEEVGEVWDGRGGGLGVRVDLVGVDLVSDDELEACEIVAARNKADEKKGGEKRRSRQFLFERHVVERLEMPEKEKLNSRRDPVVRTQTLAPLNSSRLRL